LRFSTHSPHPKSFQIILVRTDSAFRSLQHMDVDSVVDVSDMHFASVFMAEVCRVSVHVCVGFDPTGRRGKSGG
jgi:hypothetical protein